jgi:hypothetical protein
MATSPVSQFDELLDDIREDAKAVVEELRPFFAPDVTGRKLADVFKAMTHEELVKHLRSCGHNFEGDCSCDGCSALGRIFLGGQ